MTNIELQEQINETQKSIDYLEAQSGTLAKQYPTSIRPSWVSTDEAILWQSIRNLKKHKASLEAQLEG